MQIELFSSFKELANALVTGLLFGFFLRKAHVTRSKTIIKQLILKDFTVMKVIMTAIATGSIWLFLFKGALEIKSILSSTTLLAALIGGGIFGIGMAMVGYCPGTCVGALAEKDKSAWFGFLGMVIGAGIYAELFPFLEKIKPSKDINKDTLDQFFQISPWMIIAGIVLAVMTFVLIDQKKGKKQEASYPD